MRHGDGQQPLYGCQVHINCGSLDGRVGWGWSLVVEQLPRVIQATGLTPSSTKKKKNVKHSLLTVLLGHQVRKHSLDGFFPLVFTGEVGVGFKSH